MARDGTVILFMVLRKALSKPDMHTALTTKRQVAPVVSSILPYWSAGRCPATMVHDLNQG
jgi:hypothetical protein